MRRDYFGTHDGSEGRRTVIIYFLNSSKNVINVVGLRNDTELMSKNRHMRSG